MDIEYFIMMGEEPVPAGKQVYYEFYRPLWKERKRKKVRREMEYSYESVKDTVPDGKVMSEIAEDLLLLVLCIDAALLFSPSVLELIKTDREEH
jgi:hypothetical protein